MFKAFKNKKTSILLLTLPSVAILAMMSAISCRSQVQNNETGPNANDNNGNGGDQNTTPPTEDTSPPDNEGEEKPDEKPTTPLSPFAKEVERIKGFSEYVGEVPVSSKMFSTLKSQVVRTDSSNENIRRALLKAINSSCDLGFDFVRFNYEIIECKERSSLDVWFKIKVTEKSSKLTYTSDQFYFRFLSTFSRFIESMELDQQLLEMKLESTVSTTGNEIDRVAKSINSIWFNSEDENIEPVRVENGELTLTLDRRSGTFEESFRAYYGKSFDDFVKEIRKKNTGIISSYSYFLEEMVYIKITLGYTRDTNTYKTHVSARAFTFLHKDLDESQVWGHDESLTKHLGSFELK